MIRPIIPETAIAHAFLKALIEWAQRADRSERRIALPSGAVDGDELRQVVVALVCARATRDAGARS